MSNTKHVYVIMGSTKKTKITSFSPEMSVTGNLPTGCKGNVPTSCSFSRDQQGLVKTPCGVKAPAHLCQRVLYAFMPSMTKVTFAAAVE